MGCCCCCCQKAVPPPDNRLIGLWASDPNSLKFTRGYGSYRVSNKIMFQNLGHGLKLQIQPSGFIHFIEVNGHSCRLIDGPATYWGQYQIESICNSQISYNTSRLHEGVLIVNGKQLRRYEHTLVTNPSERHYIENSNPY